MVDPHHFSEREVQEISAVLRVCVPDLYRFDEIQEHMISSHALRPGSEPRQLITLDHFRNVNERAATASQALEGRGHFWCYGSERKVDIGEYEPVVQSRLDIPLPEGSDPKRDAAIIDTYAKRLAKAASTNTFALVTPEFKGKEYAVKDAGNGQFRLELTAEKKRNFLEERKYTAYYDGKAKAIPALNALIDEFQGKLREAAAAAPAPFHNITITSDEAALMAAGGSKGPRDMGGQSADQVRAAR